MPDNGPSDNRRFDGGDESRVQALMAENERLREALIAARDTFKRFGFPVYADACDEALDGQLSASADLSHQGAAAALGDEHD